MTQIFYAPLLSLQIIYDQENIYWHTDNIHKSTNERRVAHILYTLLVSKTRTQHEAVKATLHELYLSLIRSIHRHFRTQISPLYYEEFMVPSRLTYSHNLYNRQLNELRTNSSHPTFHQGSL